MTNADKIRNMSNEELALLIDDSIKYFNCDECNKKDGGDSDCRNEGACLPYIKEWLMKEAKD